MHGRHTDSAHNWDREPLKVYLAQGGKVTEAIGECAKSGGCHEYCLDELDDVHGINQTFIERGVVGKCLVI